MPKKTPPPAEPETTSATPPPAPPAGLHDRIKRMATVDIHKIVDFEAGNPKGRTAEDIAMLDASLKTNGYAMPLLVREEGDRYELLDGHGRVGRIREKYPEVRELKVIVLDVASVAEGRKLILGLQHTAAFDLGALDAWVREGLDEGLTVEDIVGMTRLGSAELGVLADLERDLAQLLESGEPENESSGPEEDEEEPARDRSLKFDVFPLDLITETAFQHCRKVGFQYPDPSPGECMISINKLAGMSMEALARTHEGYAVADKFQRHRWDAVADGKLSPVQSFNTDEKLRYLLRGTIEAKATVSDTQIRSMIGMFGGGQVCSNFRPGFAAHIYRRFCPAGGTVLDTSAGFGGRVVGALASTVVAHYIGIDPNEPSIEGSRRLLEMLGRSSFAEFAVEPAEDIEHERWAERADFMFTSPPYFNKEVYSSAPNQSGNRYPQAEQWREKFLLPMLELTFATLKPGAFAAINIADCDVGGVRYQLGDWTIDCGRRAGFEVAEHLQFPVNGRRTFGKGAPDEPGAERFEPIYMFRKPLEAGGNPKKTRSARK